MMPAFLVEFRTPKEFALKGLWFGPKRAKRAIVFVHGLGGSAFSMRDVMGVLARKGEAVLTFSNRGHDVISGLSHSRRSGQTLGGKAHEVFTDCVDDIEGAIRFVRKQGARDIFLAGHSTGAQKSVFWAHRQKGRGVKGIILLGPISDYSSILKERGASRLARAEKIARALIRRGRKHELLPRSAWPNPIDAQRFISLYGGDSSEEVFTYAQPKKNPRSLRSVKKPALILLAGKDEHGDRPAREIAGWFRRHLQKGQVVIVPGVLHSFRGAERAVAKHIINFVKGK